MKQFELTVLALVRRKVVVTISDEMYKLFSDEDLTPQENAKMLYEDDGYYYFKNIEDKTDYEEKLHEEVLGVEELPKEK